MRPTPATLAILSVFVAGAVGAGIWLAGTASDCANRWSASGFEHDYRNGQCMVLAGSRWIPEARVVVHVRAPG